MANSLATGYQNQSTAWILGGDRLTVNGHDYGTLNGNGVVWYQLASGVSNYPRRPHALSVHNTTNSVFTGIRFVRSQMWTMDVMFSQNVLFEDIYVNNTVPGIGAQNTDGCDTIYTNNLIFRRWTIDNGDDAISLKANSTNILVEDCTFYNGQGFAIGSIGQYKGVFEYIQNVLVRNITVIGTKYAGYIKTWTGVQQNYPPNGGGGGLGYMSDITWTDFTLDAIRSTPFSISQCTSYSGAVAQCETSLFKIENVTLTDFTGSADSTVFANMQCSADAGGCSNLEIERTKVVDTTNGTAVNGYLCGNVVDPIGFVCTGNVTSNGGGS